MPSLIPSPGHLVSCLHTTSSGLIPERDEMNVFPMAFVDSQHVHIHALPVRARGRDHMTRTGRSQVR